MVSIVSIKQQMMLELSSMRMMLLKTVLGWRMRLLTTLLRRRIQRWLHSARRRTPPLLHRLPTHRHVIFTSVQIPPPIKLEIGISHKLFSFFFLFLLLLLPLFLQTPKMLLLGRLLPLLMDNFHLRVCRRCSNLHGVRILSEKLQTLICKLLLSDAFVST